MQINNLIVCDDIRQEVNGKLFLIGVYNDLVLKLNPDQVKWPYPMKLAFFSRFLFDRKDEIPDYFVFNFIHNQKVFWDMKGKVLVKDKSSSLDMILFANQFPIQAIGEITFKIEFLKNQQTIAEIIPRHTLNVKLTG